MIKNILSKLKCRKADQFVELLICFSIVIVICVGLLTIGGLFINKMWLNNKLSDMSRLISVSGSYMTADVQDIEDEIIDKFGGTISYSGSILDTTLGTVQLGDVVHINYETQIPVFSVGALALQTDVDIEKDAISEVYYK